MSQQTAYCMTKSFVVSRFYIELNIPYIRYGKMLLYTEYTDCDLFTLIGEGDYMAYTEIYNRYSALLYVHAYQRLRNREEAKDVIQELFITIWERRLDIKVKSSPAAYLYTAVRNQVIKVISRKQVREHYLSSLYDSIQLGYANTDHAVREKDLIEVIEKEVNALPEKMRLVFNLSRKSHLSHREIAEKLNLSEATIKKQVNNALKVLRVKLQALLFLILLFFLSSFL